MRPAQSKIMKLAGIAALLAAVFFLLLFLDRFKFDSHTLFMHAVRNLGHVPLFGLIAVILLWILQLTLGGRLGAIHRYILAWIGAAGLGAISEYMQYFSPRNADLMDLVNDIAGAASFLALHYLIDARLSNEEKKQRDRLRMPIRIAALAILLAVSIPVIRAAAASLHRRASFPEMYTFDSRFEKDFIKPQNAVLEFVDPPFEWKEKESRVGRITFLPAKYPGLEFEGPWPDWSEYRTLTIDIFSTADSTVFLTLMIKDDEIAGYKDRFNRELRIAPGLNEIRIPVAEIENGPENRRLDMASLEAIHLFMIEPREPLVLYIDDLFLE
jgi:hypothetical protein